MRRLAFLLLMAGLHPAAHAACQTGLAERLHAKLNPDRALLHELAVCEPWRGNPGRSIVVLPMQGQDTLDLDILVVQQPDNGNSERATLLARLAQALPDDGTALPLRAIELDKARWRLAPEWRGFGLRLARRSEAGAPPASSQTLSLYALQGTRLSPILEALEVSAERAQGHACPTRFERQQSQLSVARADGGQRLADLLVQRSEWKSYSELQGNECVEFAEAPRYRVQTLRFDGERYRPLDGEGAAARPDTARR